MTRMIPNRPPKDTSAGECVVFDLIRSSADSDAYVCLHSLGIARHQRKEYAEADFVMIGPSGVYCLEVKGGHIVRRDGTWIIGWPGGKTYESEEGPFAQVESTRWPLIEFLKQRTSAKIRNEAVFGWGVVFPDIIFAEADPEWDNDVVYDQRDKASPFVTYVERLERYFRRRLHETGKNQPPQLSPTRIAAIVDCLRGDFELVPSIRGLLSESRRELVSLSADQFKVLDLALHDANPRIICDGGAGTGKTLIAMEAARRLSSSGKRVLLLCFNDNLKRFLTEDVVQSNERIRVSTVYAFLSEVIRRGGFAPQLAAARATVSSSELYGKVYPGLFESAAESLVQDGELPQYDVLIIDEAQDVLNASVLNCLELVLDNGFAGGRWLVCMDSGAQSDVYGRMDQAVIARLKSLGAVTFFLTENFRNPKSIVGEMCSLTSVARPICRRELPSNVDYRLYGSDREQGKKLRSLLVELLREGVLARDITVLSGTSKDDSCMMRHRPDIGKSICFLDRDGEVCPADAISAATIAGFKGLENEVIILTDLPKLQPLTDWARSILYVGMTRARSKLFALVDTAFLDARTQP